MIYLANTRKARVTTYDAGVLTALSTFATSFDNPLPSMVQHVITHNQGKDPFDIVVRSTDGANRHNYSYTRDDGNHFYRIEGFIYYLPDPNTVVLNLAFIPGGAARVKLYFA